jgi:hypothetical protein
MTDPIRLVEITDDAGAVVEAAWLAAAEGVHRQLRVAMDPYDEVMGSVFVGGGRMRVAVVDGAVAGVAVYRVYPNTHSGVHMYVDDLVTDDAQRSRGVGAALLRSLESTARDVGCSELHLDSGTQRQRAHEFYFREGMKITSFHFAKRLSSSSE